MDQFNALFEHFPQYRIIVCRRCQYAVAPAHVIRHIQDQHKSISKVQSREIANTATTLHDVAASPEEVVYPDVDCPPVSRLPVYANGLRCTARIAGSECGYVCRQRQWMITHCKDNHNWVNPRKRGRNPHSPVEGGSTQIWIENQACQRFFKTGGW